MIHQLGTHCWHLLDADGKPHGNPDFTPHFATEAAAKKLLSGIDLGWTPQILDFPCWAGSCDGCGDEPDWDEVDGMHFASLADARVSFEAYDFTVDGTRVWCEDCKPEGLPAELPGQLPLVEVRP